MSYRFRNYYECPVCHHLWDDEWDAMCDDACPVCGVRNISPVESEDISTRTKLYQLRWEVIDETNPEVETILDVYPIAEFDEYHGAKIMKHIMELYDAKCPHNINAKLRIEKPHASA